MACAHKSQHLPKAAKPSAAAIHIRCDACERSSKPQLAVVGRSETDENSVFRYAAWRLGFDLAYWQSQRDKS